MDNYVPEIIRMYFKLLDGTTYDDKFEFISWLNDNHTNLRAALDELGIKHTPKTNLGDVEQDICDKLSAGWLTETDCIYNSNITRCLTHQCGFYNRCGNKDCPHCKEVV